MSSTSLFIGDQDEQNAYHMVKRRREQASLVTLGSLSELQRYLVNLYLKLMKKDHLIYWVGGKQIKVSILYFPLWLMKYY